MMQELTSVIPAQPESLPREAHRAIQTTTARKDNSTGCICTTLIAAHINTYAIDYWIPACAGMTGSVRKQGW